MSVAARRTVFAAGLIGLVAALLMLSGGPFASNANALPSTVDCSKLTGNDKHQCQVNRCDSRGAGSPTCRKLEKQTGGGNKTPTTQCGAGTTPATVNGQSKCLKAGQKCKKKYKTDYATAGFKCKGKKNKHTGKKVYKLKKA